jgi:predicted phosphodiesterase
MLRMVILVISDIHANLSALEAVLHDAPSFDAVWCLGDLVGYGPDPNECVARVQTLPNLTCLIGNHDQAALRLIPLSRFNRDARDVAAWSGEVLSEENAAFLRSLPTTAIIEEFTLAHGSPSKPVWEYILHPLTAEANFEILETDYCLVGHTHLPLIFHKPSPQDVAYPLAVPPNMPLALSPRLILNPGSVGQPRDMDPRAAYATLDPEKLEWQLHRVPYDIDGVRERMLDVGLPERQARRLVDGW